MWNFLPEMGLEQHNNDEVSPSFYLWQIKASLKNQKCFNTGILGLLTNLLSNKY